MNKKAIIAGVMTVGVLSFGSTLAFAQTPSDSSAAAKVAQREANQATRLEDAKTRADNEISRRTTSLNALITRVAAIKKLSATTKSTLTGQIQTEVTTLTTLKTKIDADTILTALKTDIQSIVADHRIYALFIPKTNIAVGSDLILQATDSFTDIQTKLTAKVTAAQTAGQDVTAMQASLTDMATKVADAKTQANNAVTTVTPLVPDKATNYTPTLQSAKTMLQASRQDLEAARKDAQSVIMGLKGLKTAVKTASSSAASTSALPQ